jgi:hypothetical protein
VKYGKLREKEVEVCKNYEKALILLLEIRECDEDGDDIIAAVLARFLGEIILQPKHRIVCMRMAANKNLDVRNYGVAARFIRVRDYN